MKRKDIAAGAALLAALADPRAMSEELVKLQMAKAEADGAIVEQKKITASNEVQKAALDALYADHKLQEQSLVEREAALLVGQNEHRLRVESDVSAFARQRDASNKELAEKAEALNLRENSLNAQAREILKERTAIDQFAYKLKEREDAVAAREATLEVKEKRHAEKVAKLRELAA